MSGAIDDGSKKPSKHLVPNAFKTATPLIALAGTLVAMTLMYFSYDYLSESTSQCEKIFRQSSIGLSTNISFLKAQGSLQIGREPLVELSERAQMTALNLKTCCTVLDAGRLDPEQFLRCKSKARSYEARVKNIVTVVKAVAAVQSSDQGTAKVNAGSAATSVPPSDDTASLLAKARVQVETDIKAARNVSKTFNKEVLTVRKAQAIETLEIVPPRHVEIAAKEQEPNNDTLNTNLIDLDKWITAAISNGSDFDFFAFTTPPDHRDWITIEFQNRSTTLEPQISLYDANKKGVGAREATTAGADLSYHLVSGPSTRHIFRVSNYYRKSVGTYLVRVVATKSYDSHEPNGTILTAKTIPVGKTVAAKIMDGHDYDFFKVATGKTTKQIEIKIANRSATLHPQLVIYDGNKTGIGSKENTTAGGEVSFASPVQPNSTYYLRVSDYYTKAPGDYELTVTLKP